MRKEYEMANPSLSRAIEGFLLSITDAYRKILDLLLIYEWIPTLKMTHSGPVPNRLPHDFGVETISGGNESRRNYLLKMIILTAGFVK